MINNSLAKIEKSKDFRAERMSGLGGSDISAICGLNDRTSAFDIYCYKRGLKDELVDNEYLYWGRTMEPLITDEYHKRIAPKSVILRDMFGRSNEYPFLTSHFDGLIVIADELAGILECKNVGLRASGPWGETQSKDIPAGAYLQSQHYLMMTGLPWVHVAVLIDGNDFRVYFIEADNYVHSNLMTIESNFWDRVQNQDAPDPNGTESDFKILQKLYPAHNDGEVVVVNESENSDLYALAVRLMDNYGQRNNINKEFDVLKSVMESKMQSAEIILIGDRGKITWKKAKGSEFIDYQLACEKADVDRAIIDECTFTREGSRRFLITDFEAKKVKAANGK
jgi:putative phage-type endonuclease